MQFSMMSSENLSSIYNLTHPLQMREYPLQWLVLTKIKNPTIIINLSIYIVPIIIFVSFCFSLFSPPVISCICQTEETVTIMSTRGPFTQRFQRWYKFLDKPAVCCYVSVKLCQIVILWFTNQFRLKFIYSALIEPPCKQQQGTCLRV